MAASGLRSLRYAREVDGIGQVVALDNDKGILIIFTNDKGIDWLLNLSICLFAASVETCKKNIKFNGSVACSKVESHLADARVYMLIHQKEFDVVITCS